MRRWAVRRRRTRRAVPDLFGALAENLLLSVGVERLDLGLDHLEIDPRQGLLEIDVLRVPQGEGDPALDLLDELERPGGGRTACTCCLPARWR